MTLINLEDVQKLIDKNHYGYSTVNGEGEPQEEYYSSEQLALQKLKKQINSLPTHDPIEVLKEMIEEYKGNDGNWNASFILEEAISRISTKQ